MRMASEGSGFQRGGSAVASSVVLTWLLKQVVPAAASRAKDYFTSKEGLDRLSSDMDKEVEKWAEGLPEQFRSLEPRSLFTIDLVAQTDRVALRQLGKALEEGEIPRHPVWLSALLEQWRAVGHAYGTGAEVFFQISEADATTHLDPLAQRLERAATKDSQLFQASMNGFRKWAEDQLIAIRQRVEKLDPAEIADMVAERLRKGIHYKYLDAAGRTTGGPVILQFRSLLEPDLELFFQTAKPYARWQPENINHALPVELRLPLELEEQSEWCREMDLQDSWPAVASENARKQVRMFLGDMEKVHLPKLARGIRLVLSSAREVDLPEPEIAEIVRFYVGSVTMTLLRLFMAIRLKDTTDPPWMSEFYHLSTSWTSDVMRGLPYFGHHWNKVQRSEQKILFWVDAELCDNSRVLPSLRQVYIPSTLLFRDDRSTVAPEDVRKFIVPQVLDLQLDGRPEWTLEYLLRYPQRVSTRVRGEWVIEIDGFDQRTTRGHGSDELKRTTKKVVEYLLGKARSGSFGSGPEVRGRLLFAGNSASFLPELMKQLVELNLD
jgi:hypothetical protein